MKSGHLAIICSLLDESDAVGSQSIALANELLDQDFEVSLIALATNETDLDPRINIISAGPRPRILWIGMIQYLRFITKTLNEIKPDHTISMLSTVPGSILVPVTGTISARQRAARKLSHGLIDLISQRIGQLRPKPLVMGWLERRAMSSEVVKAFVALSAMIKVGLDEDAKADTPAIELASQLVEFQPVEKVRATKLRDQLGRAFGIKSDSFWITLPFVDARLDGFEAMIRAFLPFIKQGIDSTLLLAGPTRYTHLAWLGELGLRDHVRLIGKTPRLEELFASSDLICNPTGYDPLGRVVQQAISAGKPIITTAASGSAGLVRDEWDTILQAPVQPEPLLEAMCQQHDRWQRGGAKPSQSGLKTPIQPSLGQVIDRILREQAG